MGSGDSERSFERSSREVVVVILYYTFIGFQGILSHHWVSFLPFRIVIVVSSNYILCLFSRRSCVVFGRERIQQRELY